MIKDGKRILFGKICFVISVLFLIYMVFSPLNNFVINGDEYFSLSVVCFPFWEAMKVAAADFHPPFMYIVVKIILKIFALFNIATNPLLISKLFSISSYALILIISAIKIRKEYGWFVAGLFTLLLATMSEFLIRFMIARMYGWAVLFVVLSFIYLKDVMEYGDRKSWILFTLFSILGAYTHYFSAISSIVMYLSLLVYFYIKKEDFKLNLKKWVLSVIVGIITYLPWISILLTQLSKINSTFVMIKPLTFDDYLQAVAYFVFGGKYELPHPLLIRLFICAILVLFVVIAIKKYVDNKDLDNSYIVIGILVFIGTIVISAIVSVAYKPILMGRYLIPAIAVLWLSILILLDKLENKQLFKVLLTLIVVLAAASLLFNSAFLDKSYESGYHQNEVFNNISKDNNSIIIYTSEKTMIYYGHFFSGHECYGYEINGSYGIDSSRLKSIYKYNDTSYGGIRKLLENKDNKSVYVIHSKSSGFEIPKDHAYKQLTSLIGTPQIYKLKH